MVLLSIHDKCLVKKQENWFLITVKPKLHCHNSGHDSPRFIPIWAIGVHRDASGWKERNSSSVSRCSYGFCTILYGSTTIFDGSATIHHGGATNAHDASTIRYGASTVQAVSATVASRPPTNAHDLVVVMQQFAKLWHQISLSHQPHAIKKQSRGKINTVTGPTG